MPTDGQSLERKRENYKRSQTLAALPIFKVRTDHRDGAGSSTGAPGGVMGRSSAASSSTTSVGSTTVEGSGRRSLSGGNVSAHTSDPVVPLRGAHFSGRHSHDKEESVKKHSLIPGSRRDTGTGVNPHSTKRLGRTPSSPSVLFYKVKERIREKVVEASTEWPHMAAIVQERRQRAADAFEARMSIRRQKGLHGGSMSVDYDAELQPLVDENSVSVTATTLHKARRIRIRSDPASHHRTSSSGSSAAVSVVSCSAAGSFDKESAKSAFRRRSISDDTYNMQQRSSTGSSVTGYGSGVGYGRGGIVCSDDDLRAIVFEHKLRRSPVSIKHNQRTSVSLEGGDDVIVDEAVSNESLTAALAAGGSATAAAAVAAAAAAAAAAGQLQSTNKTELCNSTCSSSQVTGPELREDPPVQSTVPTAVGSSTSGPTVQRPDVVLDRKCREAVMFSYSVTSVVDDAAEKESSEKINSAVPEVVFDEYGQTWDVYGAEFDPEILGQAIQSHLDKIMKKRMADIGSRITSSDSCSMTPPTEGRAIWRECPGTDTDARTTRRAVGFFLRYFCSIVNRRQQVN